MNISSYYKIWFTKDDSVHPLGFDRNKERLDDFLAELPLGKGCYLITNGFPNNDSNLKKIFSTPLSKNKLKIISLEDIGKDLGVDPVDKKLFEIAQKEIREGHLASASDIVRILPPCVKYGLYSDFDVEVREFKSKESESKESESKESESKESEFGFAVNVDSKSTNNNIFWFNEEKHKEGILKLIRERTLEIYDKEPEEILKEILKELKLEEGVLEEDIKGAEDKIREKELKEFIDLKRVIHEIYPFGKEEDKISVPIRRIVTILTGPRVFEKAINEYIRKKDESVKNEICTLSELKDLSQVLEKSICIQEQVDKIKSSLKNRLPIFKDDNDASWLTSVKIEEYEALFR